MQALGIEGSKQTLKRRCAVQRRAVAVSQAKRESGADGQRSEGWWQTEVVAESCWREAVVAVVAAAAGAVVAVEP